jgi:hypothetical protein
VSKGRIKRLQIEAYAQAQQIELAGHAICALCDRPIPPALRDAHHLVPKSRGGAITVYLHRACHKQIHALFTETELAKNYASPEALRTHPHMAKFISWVKDKPAEFNPPARRSKIKGQL